mmetsp:Transcript_32671/g.92686  ORF Transcript_32671/g.92686 Transcript_32671/m.92686 type:complete len:241 (+) Transcript_32671:892-1614(+)
MAEDGDSILLQPGGVYAPQGQLVVRRAVQIATARGGAPAEIHLVEGIQLSSQSGCHFQRLRLRVVASAIAGLQLISGGRALLQDVDFEISETSQDCTALLVQGDTCEALLFRCRINAERLAAEADESEPEAFLQWESSRQLSVDWEPAGGDGTEGQDGLRWCLLLDKLQPPKCCRPRLPAIPLRLGDVRTRGRGAGHRHIHTPQRLRGCVCQPWVPGVRLRPVGRELRGPGRLCVQLHCR